LTSQAETIRDLLFNNWSLTGELSKTPLDNMKEIVYFIDRKQVEGNEQTKVITVEKINAQEDEDSVVQPNFTEKTDKYVITLYYRVIDVQQVSYSDALDNVEQMAIETQRIITLAFNPVSTVGPFFVKSSRWEKLDMTDQAQPQLERKFYLSLSNIVSVNEVYTGYGGLLIFDTSDSVGDSLPVSDFTYESVADVSINEGFEQIPYLTKDVRSSRGGAGVPYLGRGVFAGTFSALTYANQDNLEGTTLDKIPNIYLPQTNSPQIGQQGTVVFLSVNTNPAGSTLTTKSFMKINTIEKITGAEELVKYRISGQLIKPSETSFS